MPARAPKRPEPPASKAVWKAATNVPELPDDPVGDLAPPPDLSLDGVPPEVEEAWFDLGHEPALTQEPTLFGDEVPLPSEPAISAPAPSPAQRVAGTKALAARITGELNPEQARAVTTTDGPLLILAGAGSGKTRVLAHRVAYLVGVRGIPPWQILAVTFTNRAAGELRERIIALIGDKAGRDVQAGTFHALCARVLRRDGEAIGIGRNFVVYDTDDQGALMKRILNDEGVEAKGPTRPSAILGRISRAKNEMVDPSEIDEYIPITGGRIAVARLAGLYRDRLAAAGALDFDDLLLAAVRLFDQAPDVLTRYQDRWRFLHVDEYQDTNRPQYLWIKALAAKHRNLAVVGDDDQSIYGWRGADIRNILDFERDYPDAVVVKLEQNYRSTQLILDAAHAVVSRNTARTEKKLWTSNAGGRLIRRYEAYDEDDEAEWIARRIEELVGGGSVLTRRADDDAEKLKATDVAVMYRMNAQSRAIEEAFLRYRIPYQLVGGTRFYQRREVKDALAYLRVLRSDTDVVSFERIINVPSRKIGDKTIEALRGAATRGDLSTWEAIEAAVAGTHGLETLGSAARRAITEFAILIKRLRARIGVLGLPELVDEVLEQSGYRAMLADGTEEGEERWANLLELREVTTRYDDLSPEDALDRLLEETALVADQDSYEGQTEAVTLITLHAAKGLEFPVVFIAGLEEGVFPTSRAIDAEREMPARQQPMEEERRLAYVGITRAKRRLYLTHASRRVFRGMGQLSIPSRFLTEIPAELMEGPLLVEGGGAAGPLDLDLVFGRRAGRLIGGVRPGAAAFRTGSGIPGAPTIPGGTFQPSRDLAAKRAAFAAGAPSGSLGPQRLRGIPAWDDELLDFEDAGAEELPVRGLEDAPEAAGPAPPPRPARPVIPGERRFRDGDRIRHARFGAGIVVTSKLTRSDEEVTVAFADPSVGRKTMLASIAGLDLVG